MSERLTETETQYAMDLARLVRKELPITDDNADRAMLCRWVLSMGDELVAWHAVGQDTATTLAHVIDTAVSWQWNHYRCRFCNEVASEDVDLESFPHAQDCLCLVLKPLRERIAILNGGDHA